MYNVDKAIIIIKNNIDAIYAEATKLETKPIRNERMAENINKRVVKIKDLIARIESDELPIVNNSTEAVGQEIIDAEIAIEQGRTVRTWLEMARDLMNPINTRDIRGM